MNCSKLNKEELYEFYNNRRLLFEAENFPFRIFEVKDYYIVQALPDDRIYEIKAFDYIEALNIFISFGKEMLDKCNEFLKMNDKKIEAVKNAIFIVEGLKEEILNEEKGV